MGIQLIDEEEKLIFESQGARLYYRRIPMDLIQAWQKQHTTRGETDWGAVSKKALEYAVLDWSGVYAGEEEIPFSKELILKLPGGFINDFLSVLMDGTQWEAEIKNSKPTSSKATT